MAELLTRRVSPIHISFPLHRRPRLTVSVWRRFAPERRNLLSIEVANVGSAPLEIGGVYVGFMHTFLPTELLFGKRAVRFSLHDLTGQPQPPYVLVDSSSVRWRANLDQVKEQLVAEQLRLSSHLRQTYAELADIRWPQLDHFYTELADIEPELGLNRGCRWRLATKVNNVVRELSHRQLAIIVRDTQDGLYKAKARLEPPPWAQRPRPR